MADQLSPAFLPAYGHKVVKTPNIDALAASGIVFENAYCASPLCSPSRASFMAGLLPSRTRVYDNAAEFAADIPTFAHHLRALGYRTVLSGKMHFCGPDQLHGFEHRLTTDIYPADFGWTPDWEHPAERPSWYHNMSSVTQAGLAVRTNQLDYDDEVTFAAEREIFDKARGIDKRPLLLVASLTHPHDPYAITREFYDLYRDEEIDMPGPAIPVDELDPHSRRLRQRLRDGRGDADAGAGARRAPRLLRRNFLCRPQCRAVDEGARRRRLARQHDHRRARRSRRDARRQGALVQDELLREFRAGAADRFGPRPLRGRGASRRRPR